MNTKTLGLRAALTLLLLTTVLSNAVATAQESKPYHVYISNEKSGDLSVINGTDLKVIATIPVGKRPRGLRCSPDGKVVYVALSGTPISGPPPLDAKGNPILNKHKDDDDDDDAKADKAADGIGLVDTASKKLIRKMSVGSDPEQLALSADGTRLYVSNEDVATASVFNIGSGKVEHIIPVSREPEGVAVNPDGSFFYVTCETGGDVFAIDTKRYKVAAQLKVNPRPRSADFLPDGSVAFIPSESAGELNVIDTKDQKLVQTLTLPPGSRPMCVKVAPDGQKVYVSTGRGGTICVVDAAKLQVTGTIKVGPRPWGIAISPDGKRLFAANGPSDDVSVVDLSTQKEINRIKTGGSPWGILIVPQ